MGIKTKLIKDCIDVPDAEYQSTGDSVTVENVISWHNDSFAWEMGNQSGNESIEAADEYRIVEFNADSVKFIADAEYSKLYAEDFELPLPSDTESEEFGELIETVELWLTGVIDAKPKVVA